VLAAKEKTPRPTIAPALGLRAGAGNCPLVSPTDRKTESIHHGAPPSSAVALSPDGALLATAASDQLVRFWDVATGEVRHVLQGHTGMVRALAYSPDGRRLASGGYDQTVRVWNVADQG
jgi:WD40 repeat protein